MASHKPPGRSVCHEEAHFVDLGEFRSAKHGGCPMSLEEARFVPALALDGPGTQRVRGR